MKKFIDTNIKFKNETVTKRLQFVLYKDKKLPLPTEIEISESSPDLRNYKVSFEKIRSMLDFEAKKTVKDSVIEILKEIQSRNIDPRDSEFSNMSKLTERIDPIHDYHFDENL